MTDKPDLMVKEEDHVDTFIWDYEPNCMTTAGNNAYNYARWCMMLMRLPAVTKIAWQKQIAPHVLYCVYKDKLHRCNVASRFGHIGLTPDLKRENGYEYMVLVKDCDWWSDKPVMPPNYQPGSFMV